MQLRFSRCEARSALPGQQAVETAYLCAPQWLDDVENARWPYLLANEMFLLELELLCLAAGHGATRSSGGPSADTTRSAAAATTSKAPGTQATGTRR